MSGDELKNLIEPFIRLKELVKMYGGKHYKIQIGIIENIINCIHSDLSDYEKSEYVIRRYKNLFPPYGGLSDFYIHHDSYDERLKLNKPLDEINDKLWSIIKKYV